MSKTELIRFRCTENERKLIESAAKDANKSISEFILSKLIVATNNGTKPNVATNKPDIVATNKDKKKVVATNPNKANTAPSWLAKLKESQEKQKARKKA